MPDRKVGRAAKKPVRCANTRRAGIERQVRTDPFSLARRVRSAHSNEPRPSAQPNGDSMRRLLLLCPALLGLSSSALHAASNSPDPFTLRGHVLDPSRGCIAGARIDAAPQGAGTAALTTSDQAGEFALVLQPGTYTITVTAVGFSSIAQSVKATA